MTLNLRRANVLFNISLLHLMNHIKFSFMKTNYFIIAALTFASVAAFAQKKEKDKVLANKTYTIEFTDKNAKKPKPVADEISFKSEKLTSKFMTTEYKFTPCPYNVSVDSTVSPKVITFDAESKNQGGDMVKWQGTITGESVEGTAVITNKKGKTANEYSFTGELKAKPGKK